MVTADTSEMLTTKEVAQRLSLSVDMVRVLARAGRINFTETPYGRLYAEHDVEALARERKAAGR